MSMQVISWEEYISSVFNPLAVTIGVFDGVHKGHQSLIQQICASPYTSAVVTFRENPARILHGEAVWMNNATRRSPNEIHSKTRTGGFALANPAGACTLKPDAFAGDIINLEQKLSFLEALGVQLTVLIDFSPKFSKISGRDFINLLLNSQAVKLIALGRNFRCGYQLDTGAEEIQSLARAQGVEVWIAPPVLDGGQPVSSSRIRQALADGRRAEAERLLGRPLGQDLWSRPLESISPDNTVPNRR